MLLVQRDSLVLLDGTNNVCDEGRPVVWPFLFDILEGEREVWRMGGREVVKITIPRKNWEHMCRDLDENDVEL